MVRRYLVYWDSVFVRRSGRSVFQRWSGFCIGGNNMENRLAHIGIIVEDTESAEKINHILHEAGGYIVGRMGIPYREKKVSVISVVVDAPESVTAAISGKLGMLEGVTAKTVYAKL